MLKRLAPLVPLSMVFLLAACAGTSTQQHSQAETAPRVARVDQPVFPTLPSPSLAKFDSIDDASEDESYTLPSLADSILDRGFQLIGTPYRFGGRSLKTGFDCSGFVSYLFNEEAGIQLPRSTREMINLDAPLIARSDLEPGDILFFNDRGRGRVSHAGIYIGDDQFIHSSSRRSGGVRVDSLEDGYWRSSFIEGKRVLAQTSGPTLASRGPLHR
ncbi:C40 family peptidase [Pseudomonas mangiferae]|uniref:Peptidoglycan endopeptidase n=1 Tax=Pseudomonas mangiferae TaxID=2593654 RepID=A0A553H2L9_9PSED|nr:NlpC/P60 family protein [Pseudomonas mangiferae]TRX75990.1 peptidoglycan endopeptidase [Pseudomonas mangiferae]